MKSAFSLIELLAVLAIIGLLTAILLPVFTQSIQNAHKTQCLSNLRTISQALYLYLLDYDSDYPPIYSGTVSSQAHYEFIEKGVWTSLLLPYLKSPFPACPDRQTPSWTYVLSEDNNVLSGYYYNKNLGDLHINHRLGETTYETTSESKLGSPSRTVVVAEGRIGVVAAYAPDVSPNNIFEDITATALNQKTLLSLNPGGLRHQGAAHYLFADGHVRLHRPADFKTGRDTAITFSLLSP